MKKSELLRLALRHLWDGRILDDTYGIDSKCVHVCIAISKAAGRSDDPSARETCDELHDFIDGLLGKDWTYEGWLYENYPGFSKELDSIDQQFEEYSDWEEGEMRGNKAMRKLQRSRKAWMKWMIQYWKGLGD